MNSPSSWLSSLREKRRARRQQQAERIYQRQQDDTHWASGGAPGSDEARALSAHAAAGAANSVGTGGPGAGV
jgi:hypothetical protein